MRVTWPANVRREPGLITPAGRVALTPLADQGGRGLDRKRSRPLDLVRSGGIKEIMHLSGRRHLIRFRKDKKKRKKDHGESHAPLYYRVTLGVC